MVEDVPADAMLVERTVRKAFPDSVFCCVDSRESYLKALEGFAPEIILSDYSLPTFNGMSALELAREKAPEIPFLIVTGSVNEETAVECIKAGAWDYVLKERLTRLGPAMEKALEQQKLRLEKKAALQALHESEERYRSIYQVAPVCIGVYSEGVIGMLNPAGLKLVGAKTESEVIGRPVSDFMSKSAYRSFKIRQEKLKAGEHGIYPVEEVFQKLDGTPVNVEIMASPLTYNNKPAVQFIITDITQRKKAEQERERLREALYRDKVYLNSLIQNASTPIITWTSDLVITEFNHAFEQLSGVKREELIGKRVDQLKEVVENEVLMHYILETVDGESRSNVEIPITHQSGESRAVLWSSAVIRDSEGKNTATIVQGTDITERKEADEKNLYLSYHDHLTDLYNRRYFEYRLSQLNEDRYLPLTIVMGDVNGLKLINDSFGHEAGDEILKKAAYVIKKGCRENDVVARIGGDEFGIILTKADEESAEKIVRRFKDEAQAVDFDNKLLSISFGYSTLHQRNKKIEEVMMEAENYMYRRKMYESASMRNKTIDIIMSALYEKSDRELKHSQRVSKLSGEIAESLGFGKEDVNRIKMAGLVHDIGKIGISEKILNKAGPLDAGERALVRKHPEAGWRILSSAKEFSDLAKQILYHHERWDGQGYPEGLKGEEIPMEARIIAVADAYDAMSSSRAYRSALKKDDVRKQMALCSGSQFDPFILNMFLNKVLM
jgi:diguanylate cyclase (GGDEF)-like protein/PAS domain S-box-containing protein/putative nucleotidyltransferase with HDIG domain